MPNIEQTHSRDMGYSQYLRTSGNDGRYATDIDWIEFSYNFGEIVFHAVIEEKHEYEKEMTRQQKARTLAIAKRLDTKAYEVRHNGNETGLPTWFKVTDLQTDKVKVLMEPEYNKWRTEIRKENDEELTG